MATEMLGIMITKYENLDHIAGVVKAGRAAGKTVMIFMSDEGVLFPPVTSIFSLCSTSTASK